MLILINPPMDLKDRLWINPAQVAVVHPVHEKRSTVDPDKTIWVLSIDMSNGQSYTVGYDTREPADKIQELIMMAMGPFVEPGVEEKG
jgi:hypothetical protein